MMGSLPKTFLIEKQYGAGIFKTPPVPHCLFDGTRRQANKFVKGLNESATRNTYSVRSLPAIKGGA